MKDRQQQKKTDLPGRFFRTSHSIPFVVAVFISCLILSGCEKDGCDCNPEIPTRTILFYMGGDNNLSGEVAGKVDKLLSAPITSDCRLIVYTDIRGEKPRLSEISPDRNGTNTLNTIKEYEESNSASAEVFASVLQEVKQYYPSHSYGLIIFSHASGWLPEGTYNNPASRSTVPALRSIIIDKQSEMELPAFASAIPDGMFDFIIFEACFMAGIEVMWELKDKTEYIVASSAEIVSPGFTNVWSQALPLLLKPEADLRGFVNLIETDYRRRQGDYASLTLSLIKTEKLEALAAVMKDGILDEEDGVRGSGYLSRQIFSRGSDSLFFDFGEYFSTSIADNVRLQAALDECVIAKVATASFMPSYGGFEIKSHSGLTTYIPQERYPALNEAHKQLKWYKRIYNYQ